MVEYYKLITVSHKNLNVEDLAHFVVRHDNNPQLVAKLGEIKARYGQDELIYLNTCNRVMFLFHGTKPFDKNDASDLFRWMNPSLTDGKHIHLERVIDYCCGLDAVNKIYEVASSIDSLVVGEREIFRQFRTAYNFCKEHDLAGDKMRIIENSTVRAAKDVYTNTQIGAKPVSVASLSIQSFLTKGLPTTSRILLIGAGETNRAIGRFLNKHNYKNLVIFNRSLDNAKELSKELGAQARHLGEIDDYNEGFDAIFACTASQDPIVTSSLWSQLNPAAERKLVIDLSIPHNVAEDVIALEEVDYISVDNIRILADQNLKFRSSNISAAKEILSIHLEEFGHLYQRRKVERAFSHLPDEIREVKDRALTKVYKDQIAAMPADAQALIEEIASYMEKKCVAVPMKLAKASIDTSV